MSLCLPKTPDWSNKKLRPIAKLPDRENKGRNLGTRDKRGGAGAGGRSQPDVEEAWKEGKQNEKGKTPQGKTQMKTR